MWLIILNKYSKSYWKYSINFFFFIFTLFIYESFLFQALLLFIYLFLFKIFFFNLCLFSHLCLEFLAYFLFWMNIYTKLSFLTVSLQKILAYILFEFIVFLQVYVTMIISAGWSFRTLPSLIQKAWIFSANKRFPKLLFSVSKVASKSMLTVSSFRAHFGSIIFFYIFLIFSYFFLMWVDKMQRIVRSLRSLNLIFSYNRWN